MILNQLGFAVARGSWVVRSGATAAGESGSSVLKNCGGLATPWFCEDVGVFDRAIGSVVVCFAGSLEHQLGGCSQRLGGK